jgi:hypothetical protein
MSAEDGFSSFSRRLFRQTVFALKNSSCGLSIEERVKLGEYHEFAYVEVDI